MLDLLVNIAHTVEPLHCVIRFSFCSTSRFQSMWKIKHCGFCTWRQGLWGGHIGMLITKPQDVSLSWKCNEYNPKSKLPSFPPSNSKCFFQQHQHLFFYLIIALTFAVVYFYYYHFSNKLLFGSDFLSSFFSWQPERFPWSPADDHSTQHHEHRGPQGVGWGQWRWT